LSDKAAPAPAPAGAPTAPAAPPAEQPGTPSGAAKSAEAGASSRSVGAADVAPGNRSGLATGGSAGGTAAGPGRIYQPPADYQPAPQPEELEPGSLPQGGITPDIIPGAVYVPGVQSSGRLEHKLFRYAKGQRLALNSRGPG